MSTRLEIVSALHRGEGCVCRGDLEQCPVPQVKDALAEMKKRAAGATR